LRVKEYLGNHKSLAAQLLSNTALVILSFIGILTMLFSIVTSPRPDNLNPNAIYLDFKHSLSFLVGIGMILTIFLLATRRSGYHFVYYGYAHERSSFWGRKKDDVLMGVGLALLGAILGVLGTLLTQYLTRK
jgi:drug/metabolite transporter (DMT)-like permease